MIVTIEIEAFIKRIEDKLPQLTGATREQAQDNIIVLRLAQREIRDRYTDLVAILKDNAQCNLDYLKMYQIAEDHNQTINKLQHELKQLKLNINLN